MAEVIVNVKANTNEATQEINDLDNALNNAEKSSEDLNGSLESQEKRIKTLSGAINIVGGSVELLAGSLALSGVLTEEQTEQFEAAALGAIAFADGAKRIFEGYKELSEAAKIATTAQKANNAAVLANPYVAAAAAVAALSAALFLLYKRTQTVITEENRRQGALNEIKKQTEAVAEAQREYNRSLEVEDNKAENRIRLLKAQGASIDEIFQAERNLLQTRIQAQKFEIIPELERQNAELEKARAILEEVEKQTGGVVPAQQALVDALEASRDDLSAQVQVLDDLNTELQILGTEYENARREVNDNPIEIKVKVVAPDGKEEPMTLADYFRKQTGEIQGATVQLQSPIQSVVNNTTQATTKAYANAALAFQAFLIKTNDNLNDFYESSTAKAISGTLATASKLAQTLADSQSESSEEAFEKGKKYKIASVVTSSIQAAFEAFGAAQQFGPILGPILGAAQVAAIAVASNKAIQDIKSSTFDDESAPASSISTGGGVSAAFTTPSISGQFAQGGFLAPGQSTPSIIAPEQPIQAYVLASDVTTGLQAYGQISRRRRFG